LLPRLLPAGSTTCTVPTCTSAPLHTGCTPNPGSHTPASNSPADRYPPRHNTPNRTSHTSTPPACRR
jgi:hypothetical protein